MKAVKTLGIVKVVMHNSIICLLAQSTVPIQSRLLLSQKMQLTLHGARHL